FTFQVQDSGSLNNNGQILDPTPRTFTFNVLSVNDNPQGTSNSSNVNPVNVNEDSSVVLSAAGFGFSDLQDNPPDAFQNVIVTANPTTGTIKVNGTAISSFPATITKANLDAGVVTFSPNADF